RARGGDDQARHRARALRPRPVQGARHRPQRGRERRRRVRVRRLRLHRRVTRRTAMQLFNRYVSTRSLTVFAAELLLIFGSVALAALFQHTPDLAANVWKIALVTIVCQLCLYYNDFYDLTVVHSNRELVVRLLQAGGAPSVMAAAPS